MHRKISISRKKILISILILWAAICQIGIWLLLAACLLSACTDINLTPIKLSAEKQAQLERDTAHAEDDAKAYLEEKYHTDYELNTFEPYIFFMTSDATWVRTRYNSKWTGSFTMDGGSYEIEARVSENVFGDNFQAEQIRAAYKELVMQYFPHTYEIDGIVYEAEYEIGFRRAAGTGYSAGFFAAYYDGTNLEEMLRENGMSIGIKGKEDVEISDEFWLECEEAAAKMEKDFEGVDFYID